MYFNSKFLALILSIFLLSLMPSRSSAQNTITADGIDIVFVTDFEGIYADFGTGAHTNMSIWKPKAPAGYFPLGYYMHASHGKPTSVMFAVKPSGNSTALKHPVDYKWIWNDAGSGGDSDLTVWEPIAPPGYRALGTIAVRGYHKPSVKEVVCVRNDLTTYASVGKSIWTDAGSGADRDARFHRIKAPQPPANSKKTYLTSGSFCGHASSGNLTSSEAAYALKVTMPYKSNQVNLTFPKLTGLGSPIEKTNMQLESVSYIPCISVKDQAFANNLARQVQVSPIYKLERYVYYQLMDHNTSSSSNEGNMGFRMMTGMSQEQSREMSSTFGVETTTEAGVEAGVFSASVSVTVSYALSQTESFTSSEVQENEKTVEFPVPGKGAGALYGKTYLYKLKRGNDEVIRTWELHTKYTHYTDYDPAENQTQTSNNTSSSNGFSPIKGGSVKSSSAYSEPVKNGPLEMMFTSSFKRIYTDAGTGGDMDLSIWTPNVPSGYFAIGHVATEGYESPQSTIVLVKALEANALAYPVDYRLVWDDRGSGGNQNLSLWEPIPPAGYKAMGTVATTSYNKPSLEAVVCIRADRVETGKAGDFIYNDRGTGADRDLSLYKVSISSLGFPTGTFTGHASHARMGSSPVANVLKMGN
jgi:hypothetical protein